MAELIGRIACGLLSAITTGLLIKKIRQIDKEITLPEQVTKKEYLMFFLCGITGYQGISIQTGMLFILSVYISFMAYTDYYTRRVYSAFSYLAFLIGSFYMFTKTNHMAPAWIYMFFFLIVVLAGFVVKAYAFGDAEIFMALYPYYMAVLFDEMVTADIFSRIIVWYMATLLMTVITSIKVKPFGQLKTKAMAPVIAFTYVAFMCIQFS